MKIEILKYYDKNYMLRLGSLKIIVIKIDDKIVREYDSFEIDNIENKLDGFIDALIYLKGESNLSITVEQLLLY